jgi:PAS domain S-box-containing protein
MSTSQVKITETNRLIKMFAPIGRFWQQITAPHPSIVEIEARRRAQLLAGLSLVLMFFFTIGFISRMAMRGGDILLLVSAVLLLALYILSRSPYTQFGSVILVVSIASLAYIDILVGSDNPGRAVFSFIPLALILGSVLLSLHWMVAIVIGCALATFLLPMYAPWVQMEDIVAAGGITMVQGVLFILVIAFRNSIERLRLLQLRQANDELRQAGQEVELSTQRVRTMFAVLPDGIGVTDHGGIFLEVNQSMARLAGVNDPAKLLGHNVTELIAPVDRSRAIENFASGEAIGRLIEYCMNTEDGREFDGELTASLLTDDQGQSVGFVVVVRDITLQKRAAETIRQSEARQRQILDNVGVSILISKLPEGRVIYANQTMADTFGMALDQLIGSATPDLYYVPEDRARLLTTLRENGRLSAFELRAKRQDTGQPFWASLAGQMIDFGSEHALLISIMDITARKAAEIELQFRSQFERLVADISTRFVSAVGTSDELVTETLKTIGEFTGLDRSYVFRISPDRGVMDNTHEWCAPGITPHQQNLQGISLETFPWLMAQLRLQQDVYIPRVADLPAEASIEKAEFEREEIQSLLVVPMIYQGKLVGFAGFDAVHRAIEWGEYTTRLLRMVADAIAGAMEREHYGVDLERRVTERTAAMEKTNLYLALATEIGQNVSQVRDLNVMLRDAAEIIRAFFDLYYVQVYLVDSAQTELVLQFGTGDVGAELLSRHHRLPLDQSSINGRAAISKRSVVIADTAASATFRPNVLLPNTRSEMAVPLLVGDQLIGVLDMQSEQPHALGEDALIAFEPLSGQMAIAIQNARLRQEMDERLSEMDSLSRAMSAESWRSYQSSASAVQGYIYDQTDLQPQSEWPQALALAAQATRALTSQETGSMAAVPLTMRGGTVIGALGVFDDPQNPLSGEDMLFIQQVSDQITLALESARLFDQTQTTLAQTETLYEIGRLLNNAANVDEILEAVSLPARHSGCHDAALVYFDLNLEGEPEMMSVVAAWRSDSQDAMLVGSHFPLLQSTLASLFSSGPNAPRLISSVDADESLPPMFKGMMAQSGNQAVAIVPIAQAGRWLGLITFGWAEPHRFSQAEQDTYNALIGLVAPAVQSRRLLIQAQSRAQREQALRQITSAVRSSTDPTIIMRTAVREIGNILGRKALIQLEQPDVTQD